MCTKPSAITVSSLPPSSILLYRRKSTVNLCGSLNSEPYTWNGVCSKRTLAVPRNLRLCHHRPSSLPTDGCCCFRLCPGLSCLLVASLKSAERRLAGIGFSWECICAQSRIWNLGGRRYLQLENPRIRRPPLGLRGYGPASGTRLWTAGCLELARAAGLPSLIV